MSIQEIEQEKAYRYFFHTVPGMGGKRGKSLIQYFGQAKQIYFASEKQLLTVLKPAEYEAFTRKKENWDIFTEYEKCKLQKIQLTCFDMPDYPKRLGEITDAPAILYYKGNLPEERKPSVAIIGARMCSEYGKMVAKEFSSKLAMAGIQIISGLAMGIDGISQMAALQAGGKSYGVLGCGVDICYPQSNHRIYDALIEEGGVISEYPPGTEPIPQRFPPRNRIISGLSDLVLVVEAKEKSGTLITVDMALEQGREVFAVPGRVTDALSRGCHRLISQGAGIAYNVDTILHTLYYEETAFSEGKNNSEKEAEKDIKPAGLNEEERLLWACLDYNPKGIEEIMMSYREKQKDIAIPELSRLLVGLCIKGVASCVETGMYKKILHPKKI